MIATSPEPRANPDLFGQDAALALLARTMASGRLPHGWLLTGRRGIGKATLAFRFARALLAGRAASPADLSLDRDHPVFRQVAQNAHPDLHVLELERAPKSGKARAEITVDQVRAATGALRATAAMGGHRLILVDGAEQLNRNAANALLKSLEEPPPGAVLILLSHQPGRVAATLRSRCAKLALARLPDTVVLEGLRRWAPALAAEQRRAVALLARGSLGHALELADAGWLDGYRRLASGLAAEPVDRLELQTLAGDLARRAESGGAAAALAMVQALMARVVEAGLGRLGPPLFGDEPEHLTALASRRGVERWAAMWQPVARLATAIDRSHLQGGHVFLDVLTSLAFQAKHGDGSSSSDAFLGAPHVRG